MSRTFAKPFNFFKQIASSSDDSGLASVHALGGERKRSQFLQKATDARTEWKLDPRVAQLPYTRRTLLWDSLRDINGIPQASDAKIGRVGHDRSTYPGARLRSAIPAPNSLDTHRNRHKALCALLVLG